MACGCSRTCILRIERVTVRDGWRKARDPVADLTERRPCTETFGDFLRL